MHVCTTKTVVIIKAVIPDKTPDNKVMLIQPFIPWPITVVWDPLP